MREISIDCVKKAKNGDRLSFDRIISTYRETVISVCFKYMRNREEALDMAQEVFCAVYKSLPGFELRSKFSTWLYRIAVNLCINRLDALKRRKYFTTDSIYGDEESGKPESVIPDRSMGADEKIEAMETRRMLLDIIGFFPEVEKNVIILRDLEGFEYAEISGILNMPVGTVKSKLSRAREKLKNKLLKRKGGLK